MWVSPYDYVGNVFLLSTLAKRLGITVTPIPLTDGGDLDLDWVSRSLTDDVALVSVSHVPSCCGVVSDVAGLGERLRGSRAFYVVDGCQAVGNVAIDVAAIGADVYTGAGRKFLAGPRGTGFAALSRRYLSTAVPLLQDVHAFVVGPDGAAEAWVREARDLELAERSIATLAGLRVAIDEHVAGRDESMPRRERLLARLEAGVAALPGVRRLGDASVRSGICSLILDRPCRPVYERLLSRGVHAWVGTGWHTPLFAPQAGADEFLRLSIGAGTTEAEVDFVLAALAEATR
ncbi:aminotransferase class V-fold PLP-dependent enzyme [Actinokineospora soli]|uniref:Aminotransferase class V-fold PLP-dependent enzyme n=1 Tax=Actinokineospora soli TaxID=1048753 RepID=A0ABW2TKG6_9PSEU